MPTDWEDRATFFIAHMVDKGMQSGTVKSYISAIKKTLILDGYKWNDGKVLLASLTRACKLINDKVRARFPIKCGLLELILFEVERYFKLNNQFYLEKLYKALFILGYYGLMRVGELPQGPHVLKARNIHVAVNKDKLLIVLYSSKTHDKSNRPQKITITSNKAEVTGSYLHRHFCPFRTINDFIHVRGNYLTDEENFFVFRNKQPVSATHARTLLRTLISNIGLNSALYDMHSFRIGRASDLIKYGYPIEEVKRLGRWKSNVVYKYIR